jgi:Ca-activated chloride channel family protein
MNPTLKLAPQFVVLLVLAAVFALPSLCSSGGILHVFPPTFKEETFAVARPTVLLSRTLVTVSESYVEYRIDQTFYNNNDFPLEAIYLLPVEQDAEVESDPRVNTASAQCAVVSPEEFFPTLRDLTTSVKDPSLLELAGKRLIVIRSLHMDIRQQKTFRIMYRAPLEAQRNHLTIRLPLAGERYSLGPVGELDVQVRFKMSRPVRNLFSPSHHITIIRETPHRCLVGFRVEKKKIREDFLLETTFSNEDLHLRVLTHRKPGANGAFMALISPPIATPGVKEPDKDLVFLMDTSGSISKDKLARAKRAVVFGLERLGPGDRFNILSISTRVRRFAERLLPVTSENVMEASRFVNSTEPGGGTDLYNGLIGSLEQFTSKKRPGIIVLTGDGQGTVGSAGPETLMEDFRRYNRMRVRLFVLALGDRADMALLDKLAAVNRGVCHHLGDKEDFVSVMNRFFAGVSPPQVSDISLEFQDVSPDELDPDPVPDLLGQDSVAVFGRYRDEHDVSSKVKLRAKIRGRAKTLSHTVTFPRKELEHPYVEALWAMRRMARLLEKDRLRGPEPEVREQIASLAKEYGFKTPLPLAETGSSYFSARVHEDAARMFWRFKTSNVVSDVESDQFRRVGGKTFRWESSKWVDVDYRPSMQARTAQFLSDEYFALLEADPSLGPFFALGPEITVVSASGAVRVESDPRAER